MGASASTPAGPFSLRRELLGALPIIEHFLVRLGIDDLLATYVVSTDRRVRLAPAKVLGVLVRNLCVRHQPVYALGEWAASYDPALLGLSASEVSMLNDDRAGRALASLFDADRASMLNRLVLDAVAGFGIDCQTLHNDSTSVRLSGAYRNAVGALRPGSASNACGSIGKRRRDRRDRRVGVIRSC